VRARREALCCALAVLATLAQPAGPPQLAGPAQVARPAQPAARTWSGTPATFPLPPAAPTSGTANVLASPGGIMWLYDGTQVLRSSDDGARWQVVFPKWVETPLSLQVEGAYFLGRKDAWAVTGHQWPAQPGVTTVWRTTDGGATWQKGVSLPGPRGYSTPGFDEFAFANAEDGFGFGVTASNEGAQNLFQSVLWATSDGGDHWHRVAAIGLPWEGAKVPALPSAASAGCSGPGLLSLEAASGDELSLADSGCPTRRPGLWESTDAGLHWAPVLLPPPPGGWASAEAWPYPPTARTYLPTARKGAEVLAVRAFPSGATVLAVTARPGELLSYSSPRPSGPWSLASVLETGSLVRPFGFNASAPATWELTAPAGLYVTKDAGAHWALQPSFVSLPPMGTVSFASPEVGIGEEIESRSDFGEVTGLRTVNGGRSWQPVHRNNTPTLSPSWATVAFANTTDGWVAGGGG
jgi:hypothetical protein